MFQLREETRDDLARRTSTEQHDHQVPPPAVLAERDGCAARRRQRDV